MAAKAVLCSNGESEWRTGKPITPATAVVALGQAAVGRAVRWRLSELAHHLPRFSSSHDCRSTVAATASMPARRARGRGARPLVTRADGPSRGARSPSADFTGSAGKRRLRSASTVVRRSSCKTTGTPACSRAPRPPRLPPRRRGPDHPPG